MIEMDKKHLGLMMETGYIYMGMRRFKEARELFDGLTVLAPESELPFVAMGNVDFCEGNLQKAVKNYTKALKIEPESLFAKVYMGEAFLFSGKQEEGIALLKEVAKKDKKGAGDFARALLDALKNGFSPQEAMNS